MIVSSGSMSASDLLNLIPGWATVLVPFYLLCAFIEQHISSEARVAISKWLKESDFSIVLVSWPDNFLKLFDRIFGERHFTFNTFRQSCIASYLFAAVVALWWATTRPQQAMNLFADTHNIGELFFPAFFYSFYNLLADYISLLETRYVVKCLKRAGFALRVALLLLDVLITAGIAVCSLLSVTLLFEGPEAAKAFLSDQLPVILMLNSFEVAPVGVFFYSAFFTSVWVWMFIGSLFIARIAGWRGFRIVVRRLKWVLDFEQKPVKSLGAVTVILAICVHAIVSFVGFFHA